MGITVQVFISGKTQIIKKNLSTPYRHVACFNVITSICAGLFFIWNNTKFVLSLFIDNLLAKQHWY